MSQAEPHPGRSDVTARNFLKSEWKMKRVLIIILCCLCSVVCWETVRRYREPEKDLMAISQVQRELNHRGFPCKIDGVYGPETQAAWKAWERDSINKSAAEWLVRAGQ